jgi:hypothetical protein
MRGAAIADAGASSVNACPTKQGRDDFLLAKVADKVGDGCAIRSIVITDSV